MVRCRPMTARRIVAFTGLSTLALAAALPATYLGACVPSGSAPPFDAGSPPKVVLDSPGALTSVFEEDFDDLGGDAAVLTTLDASHLLPEAGAVHEGGSTMADAGLDAGALLRDGGALDAGADAANDAGSVVTGPYQPFGPNWTVAANSRAWRIENGRLCGKGAQNHGVWLNAILPVNARIEFDAISDSADGDLKAEVWGDGKSGATATSYTNATSYIAILGGWKNTAHVLARKNEHGKDRKEIKVDNDSDDPREHGVSVGQVYKFKIERSDGKTVRFSVNGIELLSYVDSDPLAGVGHDHLGFNNYWDNIKSCYDNVKITPL